VVLQERAGDAHVVVVAVDVSNIVGDRVATAIPCDAGPRFTSVLGNDKADGVLGVGVGAHADLLGVDPGRFL
jgi:hypothetical protein